MSDQPFDAYFGEPPDHTQRFNTKLSDEQEKAFNQWMTDRSAREGRDISKDLRDYDLRGAWQTNAQAADNGHYPGTWKKPNHITFGDESIYNTPETPGGQWRPGEDNTWSYTPSQHVLDTHGQGALEKYFGEVEDKRNKLTLPSKQALPLR